MVGVVCGISEHGSGSVIGKQGGLTALHYAVRDGYTAAAMALLDAKTDINVRSADKSTPLVLAAANGQLATYDPLVKALLQAIRTAAGTTGTISEVATSPNTGSFNYLVPNKGLRHTPTTNITAPSKPESASGSSVFHSRDATFIT